MTSSPYFFASINDEYARRGEHVEIIRPNGERVLFCGTTAPQDVSACADQVALQMPQPMRDREVPVEYPAGWWRLYVLVFAGAVAVCAVFKGPWF